MTLYSRILTYFLIFTIVLGISYGVYSYMFAPIPGDTTSITSKTFRKSKPVNTSIETIIAKNVKMTRTGAFSFLFTTDEIVEYKDSDPIMFPIMTFYNTDSTLEKGHIDFRVMYNRLTSEIILGFYNSSNDMYTIPISTSLFKEKVSVSVRLMDNNDTSSFLANIYLNGEYIASRGVPNSFSPTGGDEYTITTGTNDGIRGRVQTIRVWDNAKHLTDTDFMKVSADPFSV